MAVFLSPVGGAAAQFFDNDGVPLAGGLIYTYTAGTSTPAATYTTSSGLIQHSNPIILDAAGRVPTGEIWLSDALAYKFVIQDVNNVLIATYDNINGINSNFVAYTSQQEIQTATAGQTVFNLTTMQYQPATNNLSVFVDGVNQYGPGAQYAYEETDSDTVTFVTGLHVGASVKFTTASPVASAVVNAENVAYTPPFSGSVTTNVEAKLAQYVSVKDFGAVGDGVTDDATALQNAFNSGVSIYIPAGQYYVGTTILQLPENVSVFGSGAESVIIGEGADPVMTLIGTSGTHKENLILRDLYIKRVNGTYNNSRQLVEFQYADYCYVQNVIFDGDDATSSYPGALIGYSVTGMQISGCQFINGANLNLTSEGALSTNLWSTNCVVDNCYMSPAAQQGFNFYYVKNLIVDSCIAHGRTSTYGCGFVIEYQAQNVTFTNCIAYDNTRSGFYYEPNISGGLVNVTLNNCTSYGNGETGLYAQNVEFLSVNGGAFHSTLSTFGGDYGGIAIHNGSEFVLSDAQVFSNQGFGLFLDGGQNYTVTSNFFENNNGPAIKIGLSPATINVQIIGNAFRNNVNTVTGWIENTSGNWIDGPWASYTPTVYSNDGVTTISVTNSAFKYKKIGSVCHIEGYFEVTGSAANSTIFFTTPFTGDWSNGTSAAALIMRGTANGNSSGIKQIDGRNYNSRLAIVGMGASDTQIKFTAAYDIAV